MSVVGPADGCTDCTQAWEFELGAPETEIDVNGACATYGGGLTQGTVLRLGITARNILWVDEGGAGWNPRGEVLFEEEGGILLEWEHGGDP